MLNTHLQVKLDRNYKFITAQFSDAFFAYNLSNCDVYDCVKFFRVDVAVALMRVLVLGGSHAVWRVT